jgi:hypothetical protein
MINNPVDAKMLANLVGEDDGHSTSRYMADKPHQWCGPVDSHY